MNSWVSSKIWANGRYPMWKIQIFMEKFKVILVHFFPYLNMSRENFFRGPSSYKLLDNRPSRMRSSWHGSRSLLSAHRLIHLCTWSLRLILNMEASSLMSLWWRKIIFDLLSCFHTHKYRNQKSNLKCKLRIDTWNGHVIG